MPIIVAGLAWLATAIAGLFTLLVEFFALWITKRTLVAVAVVSAYATITLAVFSSLSGVLSLVVLPALPSGFNQAAGLWLPSNSYVCLSSIVTCYVLRWVYDQQIKILSFTANAGA